MPSFTNSYTEPGTYVAINDDVLTQTNTGLLSLCIIGTGVTTKAVNNELLTLNPPLDPTILTLTAATVYSQNQVVSYADENYRITVSTATAPAVLPSDISAYLTDSWSDVTNTFSALTATAYSVDDRVYYDDGDTVTYAIVTTAGTPASSSPTDLAAFITNNCTTISALTAGQTYSTGAFVSYASTDTAIYLATEDSTAPAELPQTAVVTEWLTTNTESYTIQYPAWAASTVYAIGNLVKYTTSGTTLYYYCTVAHTSPSAPTATYWATNWELINPQETYYTAALQGEPTGTLPTSVVDGVSGTTYTNSTTITYFSVSNVTHPDLFYWLAPTEDTTAIYPVLDSSGKYLINISYVLEKTSEDRAIKSYTRLSDIFNAYGAISTANTISTAAQIAYDNGASVFYCVQPETAVEGVMDVSGVRSGLSQATKVSTNCILPMIGVDASTTSGAQIISLCKAHVNNMSTTLERKERICVLSGLASTEALDIDAALTKYKSTAVSASTARVVFITPAKATISYNDAEVVVGGEYSAAAFAGIYCDNNYTCGEPLSGKTLADIAIDDRYTREEKNILASYGCLVLEGAEGTAVAKIRHALSTATGDYVKSELKFTKIKDVISSTLRLALDKAYINTRFIGAATISNIKSTVNTILASFLANNDIYQVQDLVVAQDVNYPNQVNVSFKIYPTPDVNYILITFGVTFTAA